MQKPTNNRLPIEGRNRENSVFIMKVKLMEGNILSGTFSNCYVKDEFPFYGLDDFFFKADKLCDEIGLPKNSLEYRSFRCDSNIREEANGDLRCREIHKYHSISEITSRAIIEKSFLIRLLYRNNASWQGELYTKKFGGIGFRNRIAFRSVFELMKLIDEGVRAEEKAVV